MMIRLLIFSLLAASALTVKGGDKVMTDETVVFCEDLQPRRARLLFEPVRVVKLQRADESAVYEEGRDFVLEPGGTLALTDDSRIPVLQYYSATTDEIYRFTDSSGQAFFSREGTIKHSAYDIKVTYTYSKGAYDDFFKSARHAKPLSVFGKLKTGVPVVIAFFGDSITAGAQASGKGRMKVVPQQPAYPALVFERLQKEYPDATLSYVNKAVGGKTTDWGQKQIDQIITAKPDLVFLAFGMNDAGNPNTRPEAYLANTRFMIDTLRKNNLDVSIVLVAEFYPNMDAPAFARPENRQKNREHLLSLFGEYENIAYVDVGKVSRPMVERKKFCDISGNNVNHPNDFMHRVYADAIMNTLENGKK
jgi:lysophospholipase L1-like esterase